MIFLRINLIPFYVKHFELPLCMKCDIYIYINLPCLAFMLSSLPLHLTRFLVGCMDLKGRIVKHFNILLRIWSVQCLHIIYILIEAQGSWRWGDLELEWLQAPALRSWLRFRSMTGTSRQWQEHHWTAWESLYKLAVLAPLKARWQTLGTKQSMTEGTLCHDKNVRGRCNRNILCTSELRRHRQNKSGTFGTGVAWEMELWDCDEPG